ncbi:MAG: helix-turn-helix domain-containing protein [Hyphomicrobiaceae bacterium]|nr:helix-turn-helix domain-containing protein [Hyphomicrobiaceae bacterium]
MNFHTTQTESPAPPLALRPGPAAKALGVSPRKLAKMLKSGELRSVKVGWVRLIPMDAIDELLKGGA